MENGPVELAGSSIVYYDSSLFVIGGVTLLNKMYSNIISFNLSSNSWQEIISDPYPSRSKFSSFMSGSTVYLMFGFNEETQLLESTVYSADLSNLDNIQFNRVPVNLVEKYSVFSYGSTNFDSTIYMFGGCSLANITNIFIKYSPESQNSISVVTGRYPSPKRLINASLVSISGSLYLFGGMYGDTRFNELWKFDISKVLWFRLKYYGKIPSPRSHHSAGSDGDTMIIFGGRDSISLFNDAFSFNTITLTWNELPYTDRNPSARFGACMMVSLPLIYVYGGEGASSFSVALWRYNMSDTTWFPYEDSYGFQAGTMQGCDLSEDREIVSILYGTADADKPLGYIQQFNLTSLEWKAAFTPNDPLLSRGTPLIAKVGKNYYIAGGSTWATTAHLEIIKINVESQKADIIGEMDQITFQSAYVRDKSKIYFYGGGSRYENLIRYNMPTNNFYSIELFKICKNDCELICSPGSFYKNNTCQLCPAGTFNSLFGKLECNKCPKGTYNPKKGSTSQRQCYPCSIGQYSNTEGNALCRDCETGFYCPIGSIRPIILKDVKLIESIQPEGFKRKTNEASDTCLRVQVIGSFAAFSLFLTFLAVKRLRRYVIMIDLYDDLHNFEDEVPLMTKKTIFGGVFTFLFFVAAFNLISRSMVMLQMDNIQELKNLIPLVVLSELVPNIAANIDMIITFGNYGGECISNSDNGEQVCSDSIFYSISEVGISSSHFRCELQNLDCMVYLTLENCEIDSTTEITIKLRERFAYTSQIIVNVTSDSSIPNEKSSVRMIAYPANNTVFRGKSPTVFKFSLTPSHFSSDYDSSEYTGYHVSVLSLPSGGTYYDAFNLGFTADLYVVISLERSINGLKIERNYILTVYLLALTLIGSIPGVQQVLGSVMKFIEEQYLAAMEKRKNRVNMKEVVDKRVLMKGFLGKKIKKVDDENDSKRLSAKKATRFKRPSLAYIFKYE